MSEMSDFRPLLREVVSEQLDGSPVALLFSGGTDSLTLLWTLLDVGADVRCYTFRLERVHSKDSKAALRAIQAWDVPHHMIVAPYQEPTELARDVSIVAKIIKSARKTHVEVMWGYWLLMQQIAEQQVWSGLQADSLYGSGRNMAIKYSKDRAGFNQARRKAINNEDTEGLRPARAIASHFNKQLCAPYTDDRIREFMLQWSWAELNKPKQKMPAITSFIDEFKQAPIYRRNDNMQCGSGVREYMARLLSDTEVNPHQRKGQAKLYQDLMGYPYE